MAALYAVHFVQIRTLLKVAPNVFPFFCLTKPREWLCHFHDRCYCQFNVDGVPCPRGFLKHFVYNIQLCFTLFLLLMSNTSTRICFGMRWVGKRPLWLANTSADLPPPPPFSLIIYRSKHTTVNFCRGFWHRLHLHFIIYRHYVKFRRLSETSLNFNKYNAELYRSKWRNILLSNACKRIEVFRCAFQ